MSSLGSQVEYGLAEVVGSSTLERPKALGKFLYRGTEKLYIKGVTYGVFRPDADGCEFPDPATVDRDFLLMAANGINAIRTYTVPPNWLLDAALRRGFQVMVGLPWEQHIAFLDDAGRADAIEQRVRESVRDCAGHPAVLCFVIGNEIPASIVRWHGAKRVESFLHRLYRAVKEEDPEALATYVSFPTTEYLHLPFLDFFCFNVYLEQQDRLQAYLAQLQNLAGDRPLVMAEIGLDSRRNGEISQAETLAWQIRTVFEAGCAGVFVFAWTDEWYRGGHDIEDWDFGLTTRQRLPKAALASVRSAFANVPFANNVQWPRISVVVCTYNGSRTLRECLEALGQLDYPDYEVIVVDDGSTDDSARIAKEYPVRLISTANRGLSAARNTGMDAAKGSIVAYTDDDAFPDPHWLKYLAWTFLNTDCAGVGGPNIPPPDDEALAECVANAPGGPVHVLISATEAEHIPGCNCAFRKENLEAVGGFDPQFRTAGDDVDLCWRFLEKGWKLGFHAGAMVWHRRRASLSTYWRQQKGYGKAEALLERKWPSKYNSAGHVTWNGRLYGKGILETLVPSRIYQGVWGSAPFQRLYQPEPGTLAWLPLMPEWLLVNLALLMLVVLEGFWAPLRLAAIPLVCAFLLPIAYSARAVAHASFIHDSWRWRGVTLVLHVLQPIARLWGRIYHGLTPWRHRGHAAWLLPRPQVFRLWNEEWQAPESWLGRVEATLGVQQAVVRSGSEFDAWDLEIRGGLLGGVRTGIGVEEHGAGKQMLLFRVWPVFSPAGVAIAALFSVLAVVAWLDGAQIASGLLAIFAISAAAWTVKVCGCAQAALAHALKALGVKAV